MSSKRRGENVYCIVPKRRRIVLKLTEKVKLLDRLQSGLSASAVAREFGMNESTVRSIKKKEAEIRKSVKESAPRSAKVTSVVRDIRYEMMEKRLNAWIEEMRRERHTVMDDITVRHQALRIYEHVTKDVENPKPFTASKGWLERFKVRYGLQDMKLNGKADLINREATNAFISMFLSLIEEKDYKNEQVFNAKETCLFYKWRGYWMYNNENSFSFNTIKDRTTLLFTTNAKGDFKCKPLMIYHAENPADLQGKNKNQMPVHWRANKKAAMSRQIFWDWFNNCFVPEVEKYLQSKNLAFKVLLILDKSVVHCSDDIEHAHPNIKVLFMPPTINFSIQPLDQGIIKMFKSYYVRNLYKAACKALSTNESITMADFWETLNIYNVIDFVHASWEEISQASINKCWKNLWKDCVTNFENFPKIDIVVKDIMRFSKEIGSERFDVRDEDIEDIINEITQEQSNEELDQLSNENRSDSSDDNSDDDDDEDDDNDDLPKLKTFTSAKLSSLLRTLDGICKEILEHDPILERSLKFKRDVEVAIIPYVEHLKDIKRQAKQQMLSELFMPNGNTDSQPSTSSFKTEENSKKMKNSENIIDHLQIEIKEERVEEEEICNIISVE